MWNVTCDGSIIVENCHRNTAFLERHCHKKAKALIKVLKAFKPIFSLSRDFSKVTLDSDLQRDPEGLHVFDYTQLHKAHIDVGLYIQVVDFRPGSFVVFNGSIFTGGRVLDELDTYPGNAFLVRCLKNDKAEPIDVSKIFEIRIPCSHDVEGKFLEGARERWEMEYIKLDKDELERKRAEWDDHDGEFPGKFRSFDEYLKNSNLKEQINDYIRTYCYPDVELKIPVPGNK